MTIPGIPDLTSAQNYAKAVNSIQTFWTRNKYIYEQRSKALIPLTALSPKTEQPTPLTNKSVRLLSTDPKSVPHEAALSACFEDHYYGALAASELPSKQNELQKQFAQKGDDFFLVVYHPDVAEGRFAIVTRESLDDGEKQLVEIPLDITPKDNEQSLLEQICSTVNLFHQSLAFELVRETPEMCVDISDSDKGFAIRFPQWGPKQGVGRRKENEWNLKRLKETLSDLKEQQTKYWLQMCELTLLTQATPLGIDRNSSPVSYKIDAKTRVVTLTLKHPHTTVELSGKEVWTNFPDAVVSFLKAYLREEPLVYFSPPISSYLSQKSQPPKPPSNQLVVLAPTPPIYGDLPPFNALQLAWCDENATYYLESDLPLQGLALSEVADKLQERAHDQKRTIDNLKALAGDKHWLPRFRITSEDFTHQQADHYVIQYKGCKSATIAMLNPIDSKVIKITLPTHAIEQELEQGLPRTRFALTQSALKAQFPELFRDDGACRLRPNLLDLTMTLETRDVETGVWSHHLVPPDFPKKAVAKVRQRLKLREQKKSQYLQSLQDSLGPYFVPNLSETEAQRHLLQTEGQDEESVLPGIAEIEHDLRVNRQKLKVLDQRIAQQGTKGLKRRRHQARRERELLQLKRQRLLEQIGQLTDLQKSQPLVTMDRNPNRFVVYAYEPHGRTLIKAASQDLTRKALQNAMTHVDLNLYLRRWVTTLDFRPDEIHFSQHPMKEWVAFHGKFPTVKLALFPMASRSGFTIALCDPVDPSSYLKASLAPPANEENMGHALDSLVRDYSDRTEQQTRLLESLLQRSGQEAPLAEDKDPSVSDFSSQDPGNFLLQKDRNGRFYLHFLGGEPGAILVNLYNQSTTSIETLTGDVDLIQASFLVDQCEEEEPPEDEEVLVPLSLQEWDEQPRLWDRFSNEMEQGMKDPCQILLIYDQQNPEIYAQYLDPISKEIRSVNLRGKAPNQGLEELRKLRTSIRQRYTDAIKEIAGYLRQKNLEIKRPEDLVPGTRPLGFYFDAATHRYKGALIPPGMGDAAIEHQPLQHLSLSAVQEVEQVYQSMVLVKETTETFKRACENNPPEFNVNFHLPSSAAVARWQIEMFSPSVTFGSSRDNPCILIRPTHDYSQFELYFSNPVQGGVLRVYSKGNTYESLSRAIKEVGYYRTECEQSAPTQDLIKGMIREEKITSIPTPPKVSLSRLKDMLLWLNLFHPNLPDYVPVNESWLNDGSPMTVDDATQGVSDLIQHVAKRDNFEGVPSFRHVLFKRGLLAGIWDEEAKAIYDGLDAQTRADVDAEANRRKEEFYAPIEIQLKHLVSAMEKMKGKERTLSYTDIFKRLCPAGLHCGGRWRSTTNELYKQYVTRDCSDELESSFSHQVGSALEEMRRRAVARMVMGRNEPTHVEGWIHFHLKAEKVNLPEATNMERFAEFDWHLGAQIYYGQDHVLHAFEQNLAVPLVVREFKDWLEQNPSRTGDANLVLREWSRSFADEGRLAARDKAIDQAAAKARNHPLTESAYTKLVERKMNKDPLSDNESRLLKEKEALMNAYHLAIAKRDVFLEDLIEEMGWIAYDETFTSHITLEGCRELLVEEGLLVKLKDQASLHTLKAENATRVLHKHIASYLEEARGNPRHKAHDLAKITLIPNEVMSVTAATFPKGFGFILQVNHDKVQASFRVAANSLRTENWTADEEIILSSMARRLLLIHVDSHQPIETQQSD